jgi:hypothetical protein
MSVKAVKITNVHLPSQTHWCCAQLLVQFNMIAYGLLSEFIILECVWNPGILPTTAQLSNTGCYTYTNISITHCFENKKKLVYSDQCDSA